MKEKSSSVWGIVLKVIIALSTALASVFGLNSCMHQPL
ncbi:smalltalk protein [Bacteroides fluxus]|nr:smalltalk protein [Bacteroides fluxus]MDY3789218.1 smalltalk protein [Bacteroides fluxus]